MVAKAMIAQTFPSLPSFTGKRRVLSNGSNLLKIEPGWVGGWSPEESLYELKCHFANYIRLPCRHFNCFPGEDKLLCLC